jgi:hypothetical protein
MQKKILYAAGGYLAIGVIVGAVQAVRGYGINVAAPVTWPAIVLNIVRGRV